MEDKMFDLTINADVAERVARWMNEAGGVEVYASVNLSNAGTTWTVPIGTGKPNWLAANEPHLTVTDPSKVGVIVFQEYKRIHAALRRSGNGLSVKLTDTCNARLNALLAKAQEKHGLATYDFDYATQQVVVLVPTGETLPLPEYMKEKTGA